MVDMARIRTVFTGVAGTPWYSNLYYTGAGAALNPANAHALVAAFWNAYKPNVTSAVTYTVQGEIPIIDDVSGNITSTVTVAAVTAPCTGAGDSLPFATQGLVRLLTSSFINGRRVRGRLFLPAPLESLSTSAVPTGALITAVNTTATTMMGSPGQQLNVWSRKNGVAVAVTSVSMWNQWAVMRSRRD